jgi:hypothetical protein
MGADDLPALGELRPDVRVYPRDGLGDRERLQPGQKMLDKRAAAGAARSIRSMDAVQQLADRYDADRALLLAEELLDLRRTDSVLEVDQQVGVDQDGHGGCGGATVPRNARSSPANSSSGAGAVAISSRNLAAESSRVLGGAIVATGAPARVTSTSSPAATRLSTSEKLRAASVAVIRDMLSNLSDKSDSGKMPEARLRRIRLQGVRAGPSSALESAVVDDVLATYFAAWNERDPEQRRQALERAVMPDVELLDPTGRWQGVAGLVDRIGSYHASAMGTEVVPGSGVDAHNDVARYSWRIVDGEGRELMEGIDVAERAADGRLQRILMFHGPLPPRS